MIATLCFRNDQQKYLEIEIQRMIEAWCFFDFAPEWAGIAAEWHKVFVAPGQSMLLGNLRLSSAYHMLRLVVLQLLCHSRQLWLLMWICNSLSKGLKKPLMRNIPCCILSWCTADLIFNKNHPAFWSFSAGGELDRTKTFAITSDLAKVVMEMPVAGSKATKDSEVSTLCQIFHEMEE